MKPFLYETADNIIKNNSESIHDCCLVFPNKRTKYYFRKYFAQIIGKTSRPPKMIEIGKLIREITGFEDAEKLNLIFELFKIFKKFNSNYSFDSFYRIGEIILSDFNEIDAWLVDPQQIYRNIKNLKEIDSHFDWLTEEQKELLSNFWKNFLTEKSSKEKEIFIGLWNLLPDVYAAFTKYLISQKIGYTGLIYRVLSEMIDSDNVKINKCQRIFFIGFNALNKAELKFFRYFEKQRIAEFFWDGDEYYMSDKKQEAGDFLRKNINDLRIKPADFPKNFTKNKHFNIIGTSLNLNQAKLLHSIIKKDDEKYGDDTAVVTADESMLFPILSALPETIEKINVTMGYSFKFTPLYNFIIKFFKLHLFFEKHKHKSFYFKDVLNILKHPYVKDYNSKISEEITTIINDEKLIYLLPEKLLKSEDKLMKLIFSVSKNEGNTQYLLNNLLNILFIFFDKNKLESEEESNSLKNEYIFRAYKKIKRFREILNENNEKLSLKLTYEILTQILKSDSIPFEGESNEGLQVMGLMESRNLDFKNIIILGVNEGNLPKISRAPTFISQNLRFAFDLPLIKHQDAVFAYFFYRLLQRAENVTLIYNDLVSDSNSGEMSRFILQLLYESNFEIVHTHFNDEIFIQSRQFIEIQKNHAVSERLNRFIYNDSGNSENKAFSASALNTYLTCSLKFYYKYVAGMKEVEKSDDEFTPAEFGSIMHTALELIYKDLTFENNDKIITESNINAIASEIENYVLKAFKQHFITNKSYSPEGIQIIIKNVLTNYVKTVLSYDKKYTPFKIVSLEKEKAYNTLLNVKINNKNCKVKLFGIIDRIDKKGDVFRIIDYKSGNKPKGNFSIENLFNKEIKNKNPNAFQALFYTLIVSNMKEFSGLKLRPSLYYARSMNRFDFSDMPIINEAFGKLALDENVTEMVLPDFKEKLTDLIEEIFDINHTFKMTGNTKNCEYCEFNKICY